MKNEVLNKLGLKDGDIVHIDDVVSGLACKTFCSFCNSPFVAKKGSRQHHFAHYQNPDCGNSLESGLHLLAKQIIKNSKTIKVPSHFGVKELKIKSCELEEKVSNIRPDVKLVLSDEEILFVEIAVTNKVNDEKKNRLRTIGVPTIEILLNRSDSTKKLQEIKYLILEELRNKKWIIWPKGYRQKPASPPPRIPLGFIPLWSKHYKKQHILYRQITNEFFAKNNKWQEQEYFELQLQLVLDEEKKERTKENNKRNKEKEELEKSNYFKGRYIERKYGEKF